MAEISAAQLEAFAQAMTQAQARVGGLDGAISALRARIDGLNRSMRGVMDDASNARADAAAASAAKKRFLAEQSQIASAAQQGRISQQRAAQLDTASRERFADAMDSVGDNLKASIGGVSAGLNGVNSQLFVMTENTKKFNSVQSQTISILTGMGSYARDIIQSYQRGGSSLNDMAMSTDAAKVGFNIVANIAQNVGNSLSGLMSGANQARRQAGGPAGGGAAIGNLASMAGRGLAGLGNALKGLISSVLPIFTHELQSAYETYMRMASAGGLFTDGLQGMLRSAQGLGLTIGELTEVVTNNREGLASLGMSVGDAAKAMGDIGKLIPNQVTRQLRMLGISAKDQAEAMGDVLRDMRVSRNFNINDAGQRAEIARQTAEYAMNLKTLSAITGEDAKRKTEETRRANMVLAFQQKLGNMDPTAINNINQGMATMSKEMQQAVREQTVYGRIVTPELAVMAQQMPAFGAAVQESAAAVQDGTLDQKKALDIQAKNSEAMQRQAMESTGIGRAGMAPGADGLVRGATEGMARQLDQARRITRESVEAARQQGRSLTEEGPGTEGTRAMIDAAQAGRDLALMIQRELLGDSGPMKMFAEGIRDMTTAMGTALQFFTGLRDRRELEPRQQEGAQPQPNMSEVLGQLGERLTNIFRDAGNVIAETIGRAMGTTPPRQLASGGVISGDPRGFLATLHGNEAVIPLPDSLRGPEFTEAMKNLLELDTAKAATPDLTTSAGVFTDAFEKITRPVSKDQIEILTNIKDLMEEMVNHSRNISDHTELTAVRVS